MMQPKALKIERVEGEAWVDYHIRATKQALHPSSFTFNMPQKVGDAMMMEYGFGRRVPFGYYAFLLGKLMVMYLIKGYRRLSGGGRRG